MIKVTEIEVNGDYYEFTAEASVEDGIVTVDWVEDEFGNEITDPDLINRVVAELQDEYDNPDEDLFRSDDDR